MHCPYDLFTHCMAKDLHYAMPDNFPHPCPSGPCEEKRCQGFTVNLDLEFIKQMQQKKEIQ